MTEDHMDATEALARADRLKDVVHERSRWYVHYQVIYGSAALVTTPLVGLLGPPTGVIVAVSLWALVVAGLSLWAARQPVARRGFGWRHSVMIAAWTVLYIAVLIPGTTAFRGEPAWWLPGALVVSAPAFAGAWREARR